VANLTLTGETETKFCSEAVLVAIGCMGSRDYSHSISAASHDFPAVPPLTRPHLGIAGIAVFPLRLCPSVRLSLYVGGPASGALRCSVGELNDIAVAPNAHSRDARVMRSPASKRDPQDSRRTGEGEKCRPPGLAILRTQTFGMIQL